ncbi:MAG: hypothetical protein KBH06_07095 [Spirochaetes bacterium]|nr:hypothetical protein [Spirochaetota bacterium]
MDGAFFNFIKPYLSYIDSGKFYKKPFEWLHVFFAVVSLLFPVVIFIYMASNGLFSLPAKIVVMCVLMFIVMIFGGWISFQIWWDRRKKVTAVVKEGDDFIVVPVFSKFIQTAGESFGTNLAIIGFFIPLITTIFMGDEIAMFASQIGMGSSCLFGGIPSMITIPIAGFFVIIVTKLQVELFQALVSIANNTKR